MNEPVDTSRSHRRWNPLRKEWILVSPHRLQRPWQGATERPQENKLPKHVSNCYLCPRNSRADGSKNPDYWTTFGFDNDFAAVSPFIDNPLSATAKDSQLNGLIQSEVVSGKCRVICFSPRHDLTLPEMDREAIGNVIATWQREYAELAADRRIAHIMIFENKGQIMGCSNPHPHCQIWATNSIPHLPQVISDSQTAYKKKHGTSLLQDYLRWELEKKTRVVYENESWAALVPYWAQWPFETMLLPKRTVADITLLDGKETEDWAEILQVITRRYDKLFQTSFPYSMGIYQAPNTTDSWDGVSVHQVFFPPLLRSASVKKFMVGFELCAEPQRDITPEIAAEKLRDL